MRASVTIYAGADDMGGDAVLVADCDYCLTTIFRSLDVAIGPEWLIGEADRHMDTCERKP